MPPERCSRACRDRGSSVALLQAECTFERRAGLTAEEFRSEYYLKKPVIVTGGSGLLAGHGGQGPLLKDVEALFDEYSDVTVQVAATLRSWQENALQQRGGVCQQESTTVALAACRLGRRSSSGGTHTRLLPNRRSGSS